MDLKTPTFRKASLIDVKLESKLHEKMESPAYEIKEEGGSTSDSIHKLLQKQVDHEFENERLYLSMALWCQEKGWPETAKFFSTHAVDEERKHGMDFINHMLKRRMKVLTPAPAPSKREYTNMKELISDAVKREEMTSKMIATLLHESCMTGDLAYSIAKKYMDEQLEEEQLFNSLANLYDMCDGSKIDFEMEIGALKGSGKYKLGDI